MSIELYVSPDIQAGLDSGELIRHAGVIRDRLGKLVEFLEEVPGPASNEEAVGRAVASRPWVIVATALSAVTLGAAVTIAARKRGQAGRREVPEREEVEQMDRERTSADADPEGAAVIT